MKIHIRKGIYNLSKCLAIEYKWTAYSDGDEYGWISLSYEAKDAIEICYKWKKNEHTEAKKLEIKKNFVKDAGRICSCFKSGGEYEANVKQMREKIGKQFGTFRPKPKPQPKKKKETLDSLLEKYRGFDGKLYLGTNGKRHAPIKEQRSEPETPRPVKEIVMNIRNRT